jgi:hypothetical protein
MNKSIAQISQGNNIKSNYQIQILHSKNKIFEKIYAMHERERKKEKSILL